ncbi:hypothetical protein GA0115242_118125 [Streptomyces sp. SolWspMP-5a-2]|nr:hypothetical protein GA0115242_118125 [Streptomyces sp. SolWspMP-5a-2]
MSPRTSEETSRLLLELPPAGTLPELLGSLSAQATR